MSTGGMARVISKKDLEKAELSKLAASNDAEIIGEYVSKLNIIEVKCKCGNKWKVLAKKLFDGVWCPHCALKFDTNIVKALTKLKLEYSEKFRITEDGPIYDYAINLEDQIIIVESDNKRLFEGATAAFNQRCVIDKIMTVIENGFRLLRIHPDDVKSMSTVEELIQTSITSTRSVILSKPEAYEWLITDKKINPKKGEYPLLESESKEAKGETGDEDDGDDLEEEVEDDEVDEEQEHFRMSVKHLEPVGEPGTDGKILSYVSKDVIRTDGKVAIYGYCRVSTQMQAADGVSMEAQEAKIHHYADFKGYYVKRIYYDFGISAKDTKGRPALLKLLDDIGPRQRLVVYSISRLARNVENALEIHRILTDKNAALVTLDMDIDTSTAVGKVVFTLIGAFAEFERAQTAERVSMSLTQLRNQGKLRSKPPFGWKFVSKKLPFERLEEEQAIIERIRAHKMANPNATVAMITRFLNKEVDVPKTRKAKKWYDNIVKKIMIDNDIPISGMKP
jgi:DNA invertase Pin-like site-specific DNA recombinase